MFHERSTPRRQSRERFSNVLAFAFLARKCRTRTRDRFFSVRNPPNPRWPKSGLREKPDGDPATPSPPHSRCRARAGGVTRPVGPVGRDGRLAPHRDGAPALARAPSRVSSALQRAKDGQRATEARLGVASDAPIENRAGAAFAHGDAGAARHVRDDRRRRYVGARDEPCARSNRANPPRTRRGPRGRAPHTSTSSALKRVSVRKEPFRGFRHLHAFPRRFRGFVKRETARARRKRSRRDLKNREKRNLPRGRFFRFLSAKAGENRCRRRLVKWRFLVLDAAFFFISAPAPRLTRRAFRSPSPAY